MSFRLAKQEQRHRHQHWRQLALMILLVSLVLLFAQVSGYGGQFLARISQSSGMLNTNDRDSLTRSGLQRYINELEQQLVSVEPLIIRNQILEAQLATLHEIVGRNQSGVIAASVLLPAHFSLYRTFIIDQGSLAGVKTGQRVVASGVYLGTVAAVYPETSIVRVGTSKSNGILNARIYTSGDIIGLKSSGSGNYRAEILRHIDIEVGDIVVDPSYEALIIGVVEAIDFDPRDPVKEVLLRVPINLSQVSLVEVWPAIPGVTQNSAEVKEVQDVTGVPMEIIIEPVTDLAQ